jgi:anaerobic selenocysteine-containing dehydrogenase
MVKMKVSRRSFIKYAGITVAVGVASRYFKLAVATLDTISKPIQSLKVVRSTCSPNDTGACGLMATVSDGRIVSLIQAADYPEAEYNPRGCLKGLSMLKLIYGPDRLKHPLIRVGKRGEGKFRVATWDEALDYAVDKLLGVMEKHGPESVAVSVQVPGTGYVQKGALIRLASMFGWSALHGYPMNGDLPAFWPMTFGVQSEEFESLEWANSRYIIVFGSNIMVTRVPDSKFMNLARERGAKVLVVDPNYSPTAAKADEWVPIGLSTDAAFALGIVGVIIKRRLYDESFVRRYTDLPILVRADNGKRLLASDVKALEGEAEQFRAGIPEYRELFAVYDERSRKFAIPDPEQLGDELQPALEGEFEVELVDGGKVRAKPVFQLLKELVEREYTPQKAAAIITPEPGRVEEYAGIIERLAVEIATTKPLHIVYGASNYQWFHGDLKGRALSLLVALTGNIGHSGAGISTYAGQYKMRWPVGAWWSFQGRSNKWVNFLLWLNEEYRRGAEYAKYNVETPYPQNGVKAFFFGWNNPFDQHNMANRLMEMAGSEELELILACDFQMTTSCLWADVVLPGVSWYEKYDVTATILHPYVQLQQKAIEPLFECMPEIWIFKELARKLTARWPDEELKAQIEEFYPEAALFREEEMARANGTLDLSVVRDIAERASIKGSELILEKGGPLVQGITLDTLMKGPVRLNLPVPGKRQIPFWEQINESKPFPPISFPAPIAKTARFVKSGRIEFYKDEDAFLHFGETLPVHKDIFVDTEYKSPGAEAKYKYAYLTRNSLYRVHSTHSNNITMLELQDFKPRIHMSPEVGREKGISDGDLVKAYNDRGEVYGYAVLESGLHPQVIISEQGWWNRYLKDSSYNSLTFPWIKATHIIYFLPGVWEPSTAWNEVACDVTKA